MAWTDQEVATLHERAMKRRRNGERTGQSYYNAAYAMNPGVAHIAGTDADPFHDDRRVGPFISMLRGCTEHRFESNPGMYDTSHRYCTKCGMAE